MRRTVIALLLASLVVLVGGLEIARAALGDVVASIVPDGPAGGGRGTTGRPSIDEVTIHYTLDNSDSRIHKTTTSGVYLGSILLEGNASSGGPLAWDGEYLWTIDYAFDSFTLLKVDPSDGAIVTSLDLAALNPIHPAITSSPNIGEYPDGLAWTGTELVLSSGITPTPNWVVTVDPTSGLITSSFQPVPTYGWGTSGAGFDGTNLWHVRPQQMDPYVMDIHQTTMAGVETGLAFQGFDLRVEDLTYDDITFAPLCVLWGSTAGDTNVIVAYEIPCGASPIEDTSWGVIKSLYR